MKDNINILVVGDEGVGKSSFISAYISQHFPQEVPSVMSDVILPPEAVANETRVKIMDSSAHPNDRAVLKQKIADADSIIALHDVTRPDTFESLSSFWLPLILELSEDAQMKPVVVVGAKIDLMEEEQPQDIQLSEFLRDFPSVMNYWRCSAVNLYDLDKAFTSAEQFVNYPLNKIVDITDPEHAFKPGAVRAFQRIFRIFDLDGDNLLCDAEFLDLELRCFDDLMNSDELVAAKQRVYLTDPASVRDNCLTFEGFLTLIKMTLYDHKHQIPWLILRRFQYDDNFNIVVSAVAVEACTNLCIVCTVPKPFASVFWRSTAG
jgi:Ras family protein T1